VAVASRGGDHRQLVLVGADGALTPIGPTSSRVIEPLVAPDGRWIVVGLDVDGHSELHRIDVATGKDTRLTQSGTNAASLGGDTIVFDSDRGRDLQLFRGTAKGNDETPLLERHLWDSGPVPSPDHATIAFTSAREGSTKVFLIDPDGTKLRRLTAHADADGDEGEPVWSPDGTRIAYVNTRRGVSQVSIHELASGKERIVTPAGSDDGHPAWSPDGQWLVIARSTPDTPLVGDLWAIPAHDGEPIQITRTPMLEFEPRWF
jgi:Tol biopolymer transport system component